MCQFLFYLSVLCLLYWFTSYLTQSLHIILLRCYCWNDSCAVHGYWTFVCISENVREEKNASATMYHTATRHSIKDMPNTLKHLRRHRCFPTVPPSLRGPLTGRRRRWPRHHCSLCWPGRLGQTCWRHGSASWCMTCCSSSVHSSSGQRHFCTALLPVGSFPHRLPFSLC